MRAAGPRQRVEGRADERATAGRARAKPILVKVSPDLGDDALAELVEVCLARTLI